jgi:DNA-binding CsgD family transcriptional regulator
MSEEQVTVVVGTSSRDCRFRKYQGRSGLPPEEKKRREDLVCHFVGQGYSLSETAELVSASLCTVWDIAKRLYKAGRIPKQIQGRMGKKRRDKRKVDEERIILMRVNGKPDAEIASELGISAKLVSQISVGLQREGRTQKTVKTNAYGLDTPRTKKLIALVKKGKTLEQIGVLLGGLTRERVRQIIATIVLLHGEAVFAVKDCGDFLTYQETAEKLGIPVEAVRKLCKQRLLNVFRRICNGRTRVISEVNVESIRDHLVVQKMRTKERVCVVCQQNFVPSFRRHGNPQKFCSPECAKRHKKQQRQRKFASVPDADSLKGWRAILWERLRDHQLPVGDDLISLKEAKARTGLTSMVIIWLRMTNILTGHPHPTFVGRSGKKVMFYAESEIEIVRDVYSTFIARKKAETNGS